MGEEEAEKGSCGEGERGEEASTGKESVPSSVWSGSGMSSTVAVGPGLEALLLLLSEAGVRATSPSAPQGRHLLLS